MNKILVTLSFFLIASCGPSPEEKKNIAAVTCAIMGETRNMDGAVRIREINDAREKIGGEPFLDGDKVIKESFEYGLCQELVLGTYDEKLQSIKDAESERERIMAEALLVAEEKERERIKNLRSSLMTTCAFASEECKAGLIGVGEIEYSISCLGCHQQNGEGITGIFPTLINNSTVLNKSRYINVLLDGSESHSMMPFSERLSPIELASVATYTMYSFGNSVDIKQMILPKDLNIE